MLIVCPACTSEYEIDAERVGATGRSVRCAACRETWFITPDAVAAAANASAPAEETRFDALAQAPAAAEDAASVVDQPMPSARRPSQKSKAGSKKRRSPAGATLRTLSPALAAGLVLFVLLPLVLLGRSTLVRAMPQTADLFARIGLPVNLRGVDLRDVVAFQNPPEGDHPAELVVEGDLVGVGRERVAVPDIALDVRDEHGQTLYRWTVPAPRAALEAAETARFRASLSAPPAKSRAVQVRFVEAGAGEGKRAEAGSHQDKPHDAGAHAAEPVVPHAEAGPPKADPHHAPAHGH